QAVQHRGIQRTRLQQHGPRIGSKSVGWVLRQDDRSLDCPQHSSRRKPAGTIPHRRVQRVQHRRHRWARGAAAAEQPDGPDRAQPAVQRRRHAQPGADQAERCRVRRREQRTGHAVDPGAAEVPVLRFGVMRTWLLAASLLAAGSVLSSQTSLPKEWIDADTGHRVVRLTDDAGGSTLYFHDNAFSPQGDKLMFNTPGGIAVLDVPAIGTDKARAEVVAAPARNGYFARRAREIYYNGSGDGSITA